VLKDVGLVTERAEGTRRLYAIDRAGLAAVREYFDRFWDDALDAFRKTA
jgi:DNA-binding transcriptional ArsR family regulator